MLMTAPSTYPTRFMNWPDVYGYKYYPGITTDGRCVTANVTVAVSTRPQPEGPFSIDPNDPLGWGYDMDVNNSGQSYFVENMHSIEDPLIPEEKLGSCATTQRFATYAVAFQGSWKVIARVTTVYEGNPATMSESSGHTTESQSSQSQSNVETELAPAPTPTPPATRTSPSAVTSRYTGTVAPSTISSAGPRLGFGGTLIRGFDWILACFIGAYLLA